MPLFNVAFEPGCRNFWHVHHATHGGGQMLVCVGGRGYYQERSGKTVEMVLGTVVNILANVEHWHGAAKDSWFSHLAIEVEGKNASTEWLDPVSDDEYGKLVKSIEVGGLPFDLRPEAPSYDAIAAIAYKPELNAEGAAVLPSEWGDGDE